MRARLHVCKVIRGNIVIIIAVTVRKPELNLSYLRILLVYIIPVAAHCLLAGLL